MRVFLSGILLAAGCAAGLSQKHDDVVVASDIVDADIHGLEADAYRAVTAHGPSGTLVEHRGWIYYRATDKSEWHPVLPGKCPQWFDKHDSNHFLVFQDIGYDGMREVWLGTTQRQFVQKMAEGHIHINSSPIVSADHEALLHLIRPVVMVQGDVSHVAYIALPDSPETRINQQILFSGKPGEWITDLKFIDEGAVQFVVTGYDGQGSLVSKSVRVQP
jgi:hypothetical protein